MNSIKRLKRPRRSLRAVLSPLVIKANPRGKTSNSAKTDPPKPRLGGKTVALKRKQTDKDDMGDNESGGDTKRRLLESEYQKKLDENTQSMTRLATLIEKLDAKQEQMETSLKGEIRKTRDDIESRLTTSEAKLEGMFDKMKAKQAAVNVEVSNKMNRLESKMSRVWDHLRTHNPESENFRKELREQIQVSEKRLVFKGLRPEANEQTVKEILDKLHKP